MFWILIFLIACSNTASASYCAFSRLPQEKPMQLAFATPENFGKTHFIVGQPVSLEADAPSEQSQARSPRKKIAVRTYFSPDDDVKKKLITLIDRENKSIHAAVYILTEPDIARALSRAKKRGIEVELVTDVGCLKERANKMSMLCDHGCTLYVYNPPEPSRGSSLMHHKFALFASSSIVWTGSYNFTKAASKTNQENAVAISDKKTFEKFVSQFERLKSRSYRYGKPARA